ncbi:MAG: serine/threonine-protein kinase [Methylobacter sp.]|nr:serine/threonine-protein kinase [Methylobacter sp.]
MLDLPKRYVPNGASDSGGFGSVIYCKDEHLDRPVAIKFIREDSEKHRLMDELNALMLLRSKHVVQVYDIVKGESDSIGIVEEYIDGDDLSNSPIPKTSYEYYLKTLWQIASGIADIHGAEVIHRDIKPNNMKLDKEGIVKIYDFGLSRDEGAKAVTKGFKGTFGFAAPELIASGFVAFSRAVDTYAFGATAIVLSGLGLPDALQKIPPQPLPDNFMSTLPFKLTPDLASLITACLAPNPNDRPLMTHVRDLLSRHLLHNKHQALAVHNNKPLVLNSSKRTISLRFSDVGEIVIEYDGFRFYVSAVSGEVLINNQAVSVGKEIPKSCVVALGGSHRRANERQFITFDVSNPEVVL